ncbi:MAG: hypothetical protein IID57_12355 [Proteobacteria bacterium]|nr:hypothetical protein [Pseudomonadota bacterium]
MAVLPFADLSPDGDQEYFSDGIAEEILNVLVGVDGLDMVSRTSSFQFKGRDLGIRDIAATLGVRHIVEGSVRKSGGTIRVTAQLNDADADTHLWSETYDRPLDAENLFQIQDDIANSIVSALRETLGLMELEEITVMATTKNLSAYEQYLRARPLYQNRVDLGLVIELLQQAVAQDLSFAKAWEMLAATTNLLGDYGPTDDSIEILGLRAHTRLVTRFRPLAGHWTSNLAIPKRLTGEACAMVWSATCRRRSTTLIFALTMNLTIRPARTIDTGHLQLWVGTRRCSRDSVKD